MVVKLNDLDKEKKVKQLSRLFVYVVLLSRIIDALKTSETVSEVNKKTGCGSGGVVVRGVDLVSVPY